MDNKNVILILLVVIIILIGMISFTLLTSYNEVDSNYVFAPLPNEKVKFTGTYLGPYDGIYNFNNNSGVIDVGGSYAIVSTSKLHGLEGKTVTVKGYFVNDKAETKTVYINGRYVNGEIFCIEEVVWNISAFLEVEGLYWWN